VEATGDYETLFYPFENDWAGPLVFGHADAAEAWRSVLQNLQPFNFKLIPTDVLGGIFRRIIDPEERHKFGQHYTNEDLVDVVNAFCVRHAEDNVLDPTCGSGSFLVRAYQRKAWLKQDFRLTHCAVTHQDRLAQLYGVDISVFAAHLATLNLAARDINDEENYPRIRRGNFFEVAAEAVKNKPFCTVPQGLQGSRAPGPVALPPLQAIVGNPPYVRQELIPRRGQAGARPMSAKEDLMDFCAQAWPGLKLSGRSDLHCYFWPAATRFLAEGGWFGFLVSSSWLDVEYGFALQEWVLSNFRLHAILESNAEPWFEDARVKTCAVILQRCANAAMREAQLVKFIRLDAPLKSILGERPDENARQTAAEKFHEKILACKKNVARDGWRAVVMMQKELWENGLRAGRLFELQKQRDLAENVKAETAVEEEDEAEGPEYDGNGNGKLHEISPTGYGGGKWGKYLRAPNLYFRIMERYSSRFVPLGEIAAIRRGITSGCDAFFMPRDVSAEYLEKYSKLDWNDAPLITHCKRAEVESGVVKLIQAGDQTVHPVEARYLVPEVHNLMRIKTAEIRADELERCILYVNKSKGDLKGTYLLKYLKYGETTSFASKKSKAVPVSKRSTCASRNPWYDLTHTKPGEVLWPMFSQYRHVIPRNPTRQVANNNLYDLCFPELTQEQKDNLCAIVNSTFMSLSKTYFARYTGSEGNLQMKIIDLNLVEVPDPRLATREISGKLKRAFDKMCARGIAPMVEEAFMECRSSERIKKLAKNPMALPAELKESDRRALDLAVLELLGVAGAREREALCDELYLATAAHFRQIRVVEIQKQEQRAGATGREFRTDELAADLWDGLAAADKQSLTQWLSSQTTGGKPQTIPEGHATLPESNDFLDANTVFFRQSISGQAVSKPMPLPSRSHAEIVFRLAQLGLHGGIRLPESPSAARELKEHLESRLAAIEAKAGHLAQSRAGDERKAADVAGLLRHWMIHGQPHKEPSDSQTA
jgi:methylase of polypeptide subunit release factors